MATSDEVYKSWTIRRLGGWRRRTAVRSGRASATFHHPRQVKPWIDAQPALLSGETDETQVSQPVREAIRQSPGDNTSNAGRNFPIGPSNIQSIEQRGRFLVIVVEDGEVAEDISENDLVRIEATGNSDLNGEYMARDVGECRFVIDAIVELDKPLTRGRVSIVGA